MRPCNVSDQDNKPMRAGWPEQTRSSDLFTSQSTGSKKCRDMAYRRRQCPGKCMVARLRKDRRVSVIRSTLYGIVSRVTNFDAAKMRAYRKPWRQGSSCERSSSSALSRGPGRRLQCVDHSSRSSLRGQGRARSCEPAQRVPCRHSCLRHAKTPRCLFLHCQYVCPIVIRKRLT